MVEPYNSILTTHTTLEVFFRSKAFAIFYQFERSIFSIPIAHSLWTMKRFMRCAEKISTYPGNHKRLRWEIYNIRIRKRKVSVIIVSNSYVMCFHGHYNICHITKAKKQLTSSNYMRMCLSALIKLFHNFDQNHTLSLRNYRWNIHVKVSFISLAKFRPTYTNLNRLIAQVVSSITGACLDA